MAFHGASRATPYRPTGLSTAARTVVRLVDEVNWLNTIAVQSGQRAQGAVVNRPACAVKVAAAAVLERGADLLDVTGGDTAELHPAPAARPRAPSARVQSAAADVPLRPRGPRCRPAPAARP